MNEKSKGVGVIIGRFQVDELHEGHRALFDYVLEHHNKVLVFIGVRSSPATETNPLSFDIRKKMVEASYPTVFVLPLPDMRDDVRWSSNLDALIEDNIHHFDSAFIYCGRDGFKSHYSGFHKVEELEFGNAPISGTERRKFHGENPNMASVEFRQGIIHAMHTLPARIYLTVDIALLKNQTSNDINHISVLLAKKPTEDKWRFPGGFVEMHETFIQAAKRELMEETGLIIESGAAIVGDFEIADWRIRDAKNVSHTTVLVSGWHSWGTPKPADDISEAKWFTLTEVVSNAKLMIMEEHIPLVEALGQYMVKTQNKVNLLTYKFKEEAV